MARTENPDIESTLSKLKIDSSKTPTKPKASKKKAVADSWEDEDLSESDDEPIEPSIKSPTIPSAPPPTPSSASHNLGSQWSGLSDRGSASPSSVDSPRRPEKTDAVARRMIAAGLGLKAPKQTEEQKAYQRSIKEQEKRKRDQDREAEQKRIDDAERAKASVWED